MVPTERVFPIPYFIFKGSLVDSRLRASNEHILIVRVPRAGERPGYPTSFFSILPSYSGSSFPFCCLSKRAR
jgi:hypothetical protein